MSDFYTPWKHLKRQVSYFHEIQKDNTGKKWINKALCKIIAKSWKIPAQPAFKVDNGKTVNNVNNGNTKTMCQTRLKLTIKTPERHQWRHSGVFIVNFEHIPHIVLVFPLLTLNKQMPAELIVL